MTRKERVQAAVRDVVRSFGTTLVIVPSILLYLVMQIFQKKGLTAGAVEG